ncbi:hypothetical protein G3I43_07045 [Streptomyces anulatus]|uniref:Uncharacterized protein n=1 Tax=Streptomyces anulatus TaxID=1892 RepID=A0A6G3SMP2_STRAQ|nr:hypothetical protein [Streptomyces anulatus]NEB83935.1 hypothetical protein [Streptomyces anulatus]
MNADTTAAHKPLYDPERDSTYVPSLDIVLACARDELAQYANANIYDAREILGAAVSHHLRLRQLVAALDAEAPRG